MAPRGRSSKDGKGKSGNDKDSSDGSGKGRGDNGGNGKEKGRDDKGNDKGKPLANKGEFQPLAGKGKLQPLADKGKGKGCGRKPATDVEKYLIHLKSKSSIFHWLKIDDFPKGRHQERAKELLARLFAPDANDDMTDVEEAAAEDERVRLLEELIELWESTEDMLRLLIGASQSCLRNRNGGNWGKGWGHLKGKRLENDDSHWRRTSEDSWSGTRWTSGASDTEQAWRGGDWKSGWWSESPQWQG